MSDEISTSKANFNSLNLAAPILETLEHIGYKTPSPIQAAIIPKILSGRDVVGQAQTGTGKTAAFALPLLSRINCENRDHPQILVLTPTRELAIQVAEAFNRYAAKLKNFQVLPVYGGQNYSHQLKQLKKGVQVVVGTPGRVMDHMNRGTLVLDNLSCLVLDEADEMLRMGFIEDVEWILQKTPENHQTALLSATMPKEIRKIAKKYLNEPEEITIKAKTVTADSICQRYWMGSSNQKFDALTRILEHESFDGAIVFVRTKKDTTELAEKLNSCGYAVAPLSGEIMQLQRERTINRLKKGQINIIVATDVAARGLDVDRITHVINYDIPHDPEAYTHRIGRTGRAGRHGSAISFITPGEKRLLRSIEQMTKKLIEPMPLPATEELNNQRIQKFKQKITQALESDTEFFMKI
ncbi:MAG: DEAD/DEAH box helicase, partial [Endozoicomonadaceae bacterium]|nr:DEAD/DEAH box helicase [Endozoicomonadaceae bacterium]